MTGLGVVNPGLLSSYVQLDFLKFHELVTSSVIFHQRRESFIN